MQVAVRLSALGPSTPSSLLSPKYELGESFPLLFLGACLCQIGGVGRLPPLKGRPAHGLLPLGVIGLAILSAGASSPRADRDGAGPRQIEIAANARERLEDGAGFVRFALILSVWDL
jgi:hypothetical protein